MIIVCQTLLKNTKIRGIALFPFVLLKNSKDKHNLVLVNHERIHLRQQLEMLIIPFYFWYLVEYYIKLFRYKNPHTAYMNISFEKEAYTQEKNLDYLKKRKMYSFWKYL